MSTNDIISNFNIWIAFNKLFQYFKIILEWNFIYNLLIYNSYCYSAWLVLSMATIALMEADIDYALPHFRKIRTIRRVKQRSEMVEPPISLMLTKIFLLPLVLIAALAAIPLIQQVNRYFYVAVLIHKIIMLISKIQLFISHYRLQLQ